MNKYNNYLFNKSNFLYYLFINYIQYKRYVTLQIIIKILL